MPNVTTTNTIFLKLDSETKSVEYKGMRSRQLMFNHQIFQQILLYESLALVDSLVYGLEQDWLVLRRYTVSEPVHGKSLICAQSVRLMTSF